MVVVLFAGDQACYTSPPPKKRFHLKFWISTGVLSSCCAISLRFSRCALVKMMMIMGTIFGRSLGVVMKWSCSHIRQYSMHSGWRNKNLKKYFIAIKLSVILDDFEYATLGYRKKPKYNWTTSREESLEFFSYTHFLITQKSAVEIKSSDIAREIITESRTSWASSHWNHQDHA